MKTLKSKYDLSTEITDDDPAVTISCNTVVFENNGEQTATIDGVYELLPNNSLRLGGRVNVVIDDSFAFVFSGSGTKKVNIIKETIEEY